MNLTFFCIGSSKCGTSTLHDLLKQHPDVCLPKVKETKFLSKNYEKGKQWYYDEYYHNCESKLAIGEIYPCLALKEAPQRLLESFGPELKLIAIVRDPVTRLYSNYLGQKRIGKIAGTLDEAVLEHPVLIENSLYYKNIANFLELFSAEKLRIYVFETEFLAHKGKMLKDICGFLGVDQYDFDLDIKSNSNWVPKNKLVHRLIYRRPKSLTRLLNRIIPSKSLKQQLRVIATKHNAKPVKPKALPLEKQKMLYNKWFKSDVRELERFLDRDLSEWYSKYDTI